MNSINRRKFILNSLGLTPLFLFPSKLFALLNESNELQFFSSNVVQDTNPYMALIKAGLTIYNFFNNEAYTDTSKLQLELLVQMNQKLDIIHNDLAYIKSNIEKIKEIIHLLPKWSNEEETSKDIGAFISKYNDDLETLKNKKKRILDKKDSEIELSFWEYFQGVSKEEKKKQMIEETVANFKLEYKEEFERFSEKFDHERRVLMTYDNYINVNILSSACFIELDCRINYLQQDKDRIITIINRYTKYFKKMLYSKGDFSLESIIKSTRDKRNVIIDSISGVKEYKAIVRDSYAWVYTSHYTLGIENNNSLNKDENIVILLENGLINSNETFKLVKLMSSQNNVFGRADIVYKNSKIDKNGRIINKGSRPYMSLPNYDGNAIPNIIEGFQSKLDMNTYQLLSAVSTYAAGVRALSFCNYTLATL